VRENKKIFQKMSKFLLLLIVFFVALNIFTISGENNWGDDFSAYISQAKALVDGNMKDLEAASNFRISSSEVQVGPEFYPWGFPLILVPAIALFGVGIAVLKFVTFLFFIGSMFVVFFLFRNELKKEFTLLLILIMTASPYIFFFKQNVLSDMPALFFLLLSLFLIQKIYIQNERNDKLYSLYLGISIFCSIFIRTSSAILVPLLFLVQSISWKEWLKKKSDLVRAAIPYVTVLFLYVASAAFFPKSSYGEYFEWNLSLFSSVLAQNAIFYLKIFATFFGKSTNLMVWVAYAVAFSFFLVGFFNGFKKYYLYTLHIALSSILLLVYPYSQGLRFAIPIVPFFLFFAVFGIRIAGHKKYIRLDSRMIAYAFVFFLLILFSFQIFPAVGKIPEEERSGPYSKNAQELFNFIQENTGKDATISFFKPRAMYLFTGRRSAYIGSVEYLKLKSTDFFVFTIGVDLQSTKNYLDQNARLAFGNSQFQVYDLRQSNL
jgi:4-amino-4-deoxy-L-arabinose transferase-like glycosyltransferase